MSIINNIKKTRNYCRKNGYWETLCAAAERIFVRYHADYTYQEPKAGVLEAQRNDSSLPDYKFSIIVPAYETGKVYLQQLIESCLGQTYSNWELLLADGSITDVVKKVIDQYQDERIKYIRLQKNGGISENTNQALPYATGDYCGLLDHDDILTPDAIYEMAKAISRSEEKNITPVMIYSDEDKCDESARKFYEPHFKYDFNLDLITTNNYVCHFMTVKTELMKSLEIRRQYDGAQDFDLVLRIVSSLLLQEKGKKDAGKLEELIVHVPKVLYHWRCHKGSTADNPQSKMYAYEAGRKAVADFTKRMGWKAEIRHNKHLGFYRIVYKNNVLLHRDDLAAAGGFVVRKGRIVSGPYAHSRKACAGYMNRMDLYQNVTWLDIRNMELSQKYQHLYEQETGHSYQNTLCRADKPSLELPDWIKQLTEAEIDKISRKLCSRLIQEGARLLLDPECTRSIK